MKRVRWSILGLVISGVLTLVEPGIWVGLTEPPRQWTAVVVSGFLHRGLGWLDPEPSPPVERAGVVSVLWRQFQKNQVDQFAVLKCTEDRQDFVIAGGLGCGISRGDWVTHEGILMGRVEVTTHHLSRVLFAGSRRFRVAALVKGIDPESGEMRVLGRVLLRGAWEGVLRAETANALRREWEGLAVFCAASDPSEEWLIGYVREDESLGEWTVHLSADDVRPDTVTIGTGGKRRQRVGRPLSGDGGFNPLSTLETHSAGVVVTSVIDTCHRASHLIRMSGLNDGVVNVGDAVVLSGFLVGRVIRVGAGTCRFRLLDPTPGQLSGLSLRIFDDDSVAAQQVVLSGEHKGLLTVTRGFGDSLPRGLPVTFRRDVLKQIRPGAAVRILGTGLAAEMRELMRRSS